MMSPVLLLVALVAALAPLAQAVVPAGTVAYSDLAPYKGQFALNVGIATKSNGVVLPAVKHSCNATTFGAACNQPPFSQLNTVLQVSWQLKNLTAPIRTRYNSTPEEIRVKLCYQTISWTDRPWRKKNKAYPKYGQNCDVTLGVVPFSTNGTISFDMRHTTTPTALWHFVFLVRGMYPNGTHIDYVQYETTENTNTVESEKVDGVTTDIVVAASVLSGFCPIFFFGYIAVDYFMWKKTGRGLKLVRNK